MSLDNVLEASPAVSCFEKDHLASLVARNPYDAEILRENLEELKHYIETGQPHPRKQKAARAKS